MIDEIQKVTLCPVTLNYNNEFNLFSRALGVQHHYYFQA